MFCSHEQDGTIAIFAIWCIRVASAQGFIYHIVYDMVFSQQATCQPASCLQAAARLLPAGCQNVIIVNRRHHHHDDRHHRHPHFRQPIGSERRLCPASEAASPWLSAIDCRSDRRRGVTGQGKSVAAAEIAIQETRKVTDIVVGGENTRIQPSRRHLRPHCELPAIHFRLAEWRVALLAIVPSH